MGIPITDALEDSPPEPTQARTIYARPDGTTTVRLLHDPFDPTSRWFQGSFRAGNEVKYLVNGAETFGAFLEAFKTATGPGHFIYIMGWQFLLDFELFTGDPSTTMEEVLRRAGRDGVQVRALLWRNSIMARNSRPGLLLPTEANNTLDDSTLPGNMAEVETINTKLPGDVAAILDARLPLAGAHHQKVVIVQGSQGLITFCGGIDIAPNRFDQLYDVHCRLRGPAALDLLRTFNERWDDHPEHEAKDALPGRKKLIGPDVKDVQPVGRQSVQVARTYARSPVYKFATTGKIEVWLQLKNAILAARKFIYMENQYFVSEDLARLLASALPRLEHLTLLLQCRSDMPEGYERTKTCIELLKAAAGSSGKLRVFAIKPGLPRGYVHTKTWIFDDEAAIIGSANGTRRSFTCDSEANIQVFDPSREDRAAWRFARRLRVRLWAGLLGMDTPEGHAELADGVASVRHWDMPARPGCQVTPYEPAIEGVKRSFPNDPHFHKVGTVVGVDKWDNFLDPFRGQIGP